MLIIQIIPGTSPSESIRPILSGEVEGCQAHVELHVRIGVPFDEGIGLAIEDGPDRKLQLYVDLARGCPTCPANATCSFSEQSEDRLLGEIVGTLADMSVSDHSLLVNQQQGRPVVCIVAVPYCEAIVDGNRVQDAEALHSILHFGKIPFPKELRRVNADDDEPLARVLLVPCLDPRQRSLTIDSPIGPEFQQDDLSPQLLELQRSSVDPGRIGQLRGRAVLQRTDEGVP